MTKRQRLQTALAHRQPDKTPWNIECTSELTAAVETHLGLESGGFEEWAGNHCEKISYNIGGGEVSPGRFEDEFGVVWDRTGIDKDIGVVEEYRIPGPDLSIYQFPEPDLEAVKKKTENVLAAGLDRYIFGKIGLSFFERAWSLRGMQDLMMEFYTEPSFVESLFERILEYNMDIIGTALSVEVDGRGIDGFYFGDDYGQQRGMLMSPDTWRQFIRPGLQTMFAAVKDAGKTAALHSCGNISEILPDLIDIGLDIYQTVQPEIYDLHELKKEFGGSLTFWGAVSTQRDLPFLKPEEVKALLRRTIDVLGKNGGYIAAPTHQIPGDVPVENVIAFAEAVRDRIDNFRTT